MLHAKRGLLRAGLLSFTMLVPCTSFALTITTESSGDTLASQLFLNLPGVNFTNAELFGFEGQSGIYTNVIGTYGLPQDGIVFSSGNVLDYQAGGNANTGTSTNYGGSDGEGSEFGNAATPSQEALLGPITGQGSHFDVVQLNIEFVTALDVSQVTFFGAFGSEEWPEFVGSGFIDGFGLYVNGVNQAGVAEFNGAQNLPVNINHPSMAAITGTELDGVLAPGSNPVLRFDVDVLPGQANNFTIILADASDSVLDTTVYLSSFIASNPGGGSGQPIPGTGATEFDPLLPITLPDGTPVFDENGGFTIDIAQEIAEQGQTVWVDPPVSVGFTYEVSGGALVTTITAPSLATVADIDGYTLTIDGIDYAFAAGSIFDVTDVGLVGVDSFILTGIDTSLSLDPTNPLAFPIGLAFTDVFGDFQVTITPITENVGGGVSPIPLPASGLLYVGMMLLGGGFWRRRQKSA